MAFKSCSRLTSQFPSTLQIIHNVAGRRHLLPRYARVSLNDAFCEIQTLPNGHPNGSGKSEQERTLPEGDSPKRREVEAWIPLGGTNDAKNMVSNVLERFQIIDREFTASDDGGIGLPWWMIKQTRTPLGHTDLEKKSRTGPHAKSSIG